MLSETQELAIRIRDLNVSFTGIDALKEVSLDVPARSVTVLLGFSGCGKTTLLRCLNRLNEEFPGARTRGKVELRIEGQWIDAYAPSVRITDLRRRVGMVFQHPNPLPTTIRRNIVLPLALTSDHTPAQQRAIVESSLRDAQLWDEVADRLDTSATLLSGGQQQRLCLARTLALSPEILLLDEPTASLDFRAAERIERLIATLAARYTIILVSHNPSQAFRLADQIASFNEGRLVAVHERSEFKDRETFQKLVEELLPV